ncbi:ParB N-terminal domain-containing protein [Candidatus Gottesmanbacteria bacterium]|nr:ParB N-terminal domain-containing protein [Candidatus Gottesmanbacteria bacterium]
MNSKTKYFHLKVIDLDKILPHEEYDSSRAEPLVENLKKTQILLNPILVTHLEGDRYVQLDGMNRFTAMKIMKISSILTQVLDYNDQASVDLSTWSHFNKIQKDDFLEFISKIAGISYKQVGEKYLKRRYISDEGEGFLCAIVFRDGSIYRVAADGKLTDKVKLLHKIVDLYKKDITREVIEDDVDLEDITSVYENQKEMRTLVIFPTFTRHQILYIVKNGQLFPGGITRFIIRPRCLDVHYPLELLKGNADETVKNGKLENYLAKKTFRIYEESTVYFEP